MAETAVINNTMYVLRKFAKNGALYYSHVINSELCQKDGWAAAEFKCNDD